MTPLSVVPPVDEVEHRRAGVEWRRERDAVEELALERGEEALAERVVVAVADRPHRRTDARLPAPRPEGQRGVLTTLIRMMNHRPGLPLLDGHVQGCQHEGRAQMPLHRPPDDTATPDVEHHGQVEKTAAREDVGDIGHPELIRARRREGPSDQVGAGRASTARVVVTTNLRRLTPRKWAARIRRATRLRLTRRPRATSSGWIRGAP